MNRLVSLETAQIAYLNRDIYWSISHKYCTAVLQSPSSKLSIGLQKRCEKQNDRPSTLHCLQPTAVDLDGLPAWFLREATPVFCQPIAYLVNLSVVTSTVPLQWKEASIHPIPKTTAPKPEAYLHPVIITPVLERKYNGNETDITKFISFRFLFVSVFLNFFRSHFRSLTESKFLR